MIYPPAPDIWLCEVLFRQSHGASALRGGGERGDSVVERARASPHSPTAASLDAVVGCRAFPRRFGAPSGGLSALPADQSLWIICASKGRSV